MITVDKHNPALADYRRLLQAHGNALTVAAASRSNSAQLRLRGIDALISTSDSLSVIMKESCVAAATRPCDLLVDTPCRCSNLPQVPVYGIKLHCMTRLRTEYLSFPQRACSERLLRVTKETVLSAELACSPGATGRPHLLWRTSIERYRNSFVCKGLERQTHRR